MNYNHIPSLIIGLLTIVGLSAIVIDMIYGNSQDDILFDDEPAPTLSSAIVGFDNDTEIGVGYQDQSYDYLSENVKLSNNETDSLS